MPAHTPTQTTTQSIEDARRHYEHVVRGTAGVETNFYLRDAAFDELVAAVSARVGLALVAREADSRELLARNQTTLNALTEDRNSLRAERDALRKMLAWGIEVTAILEGEKARAFRVEARALLEAK